MSTPSDEQTDLVLEELRLVRQEMNARFDLIDWDFREICQELAGIKRDPRGLRLNLAAEVHKENLSVASLADFEGRVMFSSIEKPS